MGVFSVIERTVHLEAHSFFQAVLYDRGNQRHFSAVCRFLLDDGSGCQYLLPLFWFIAAVEFFRKVSVSLFRLSDQKVYQVFFLDTGRYIIGICIDTGFRVGRVFHIVFQKLFLVKRIGFCKCIKENLQCLSRNQRYFMDGRFATGEFVEEIQAVKLVFPYKNPPLLRLSDQPQQIGIDNGKTVPFFSQL